MIATILQQWVQETVSGFSKELGDFTVETVHVEHPETAEHGDYSTNIALTLAKQVKKNPRDLALRIAEKLNEHLPKEVSHVEVAGAGFINFFLSKGYFFGTLSSIAKEKDKYGSGKEKKKVIIEYSSPNIAKPFGIGHLRSTLIGQALYNLYTFLGYKCVGINYPGDWGTPHGKILFQLQEKLLKGKTEKEKKAILEKLTVQDLERLYVEFHQEAQANPDMEQEARAWFKKLEKKDKEARMVWEYTKKVSMKEFERIYDLLNIHIDNVIPESFFEDKMETIIQDLKAKLLAKESQGALIVSFPNDVLPPALLLKSDGATTYFTRDLANMRYRVEKWNPDMIVIETGQEQILHFKQVFLASQMIGYASHQELVHVYHGLYRTKEGKFSTRKGQTVHLEEVLQDAIERARDIIEQSGTARGLAAKEKERVAQAVGIGGIAYNDLSKHPSGDIVFDWEKVLNLKGNSAAYIQYTFARCQSILQKSKQSQIKCANTYEWNKEELEVLRLLASFPEVVREAAARFSPNLVAAFAFDVAQKYNLFYSAHSVLKAETADAQAFRVVLTSSVAQVLKNSLGLLGIQTLDRM